MRNNKFSSMVLAVVVAFGLWLYVFSNISQEDDNTFYNIPVILEGEAMLAERNMMLTGVSTDKVSLNISGMRKDLNEMDSANIQVKVNLANVEEPGEKIPLSYTTNITNQALTVEKREPQYIYVNVDYRRTKEVPVEIEWSGVRSENFIYDTENAVLDNPMVTVMGPAAVADLIDHAVIEVDLTDRAESISESFRYTLCDKDGTPVDAERITTNVEEIHLDAKIQKMKEIKLLANVVYGGGATELNTTVTVVPGTIRVSGGEGVLDELGDSIQICTINMSEVDKSTSDLTYTISLPEGVTNETGVAEATVQVRISGVSTKELTIDNIQAVNIPAGMVADIINANLTVKVRGPSAMMLELTDEDVYAVVDFSAAEIGTATYKATIRFGEGYEALGALKTYSVSATVASTEE